MNPAIKFYRLILRPLQFLAYPIIAIGALVSARWREGWRERLGFVPKLEKTSKRRVWVHAASVGEVETVWPLVKRLAQNFEVVVSTLTPTGKLTAIKKGDANACFIFPLDLPKFLSRALERIKPNLVIVAETEIWPCLIYELKRRKIPFAFVNARISDRTFKSYKMLRPFFKTLLSEASLVGAQNVEHQARFVNLGITEQKVRVLGNFKLDIEPDALFKRAKELEQELIRFIPHDKQMVVFASTHKGEESLLLPVIASIKSKVFCVLVPRHPERANEVARLFESENMSFSLLSSGNSHPELLIVDAIGKLLFFYKNALCAFVGGSLVPIGGHNVAEPAALGKPAIFGPHTFNFREPVNILLNSNAAIAVKDSSELSQAITNFLNNPDSANEMGLRAQKAIEEHRGATDRTYSAVYGLLEGALKLP